MRLDVVVPVLLSAGALVLAACSRNPGPASAPDPGFDALPDTLVCVVDRTTPRGLRELPAKRRSDGEVVVRIDGTVRSLDSVHPVSLIAGYAGAEPWYRSDTPVEFGGTRFLKLEQERRVQLEQLGLAGEFRGIPLYADPDDESPPQALYVPVRPGCVFQAYVRRDLMG